MGEDITFEEWQDRADAFLRESLGIDDLLDEDDPYDMADAMEEAYDDEEDPEDFIREAFSDDFAAQEGAEEELRLGEESELNFDEDEDEDEEDEDEDEEDDDEDDEDAS